MTQLTADNIKLYESEKLNDNPDGGGRATGNEVQSGQVNNVFQDISRVDHTTGAVELRKLFMGVDTDNQAPLLGAHMIVAKLPTDPNVNVTLFSTGSETDVRADARDYLESYLVQTTRAFPVPLGRQLKGSTSIILFQISQAPVTLRVGDTKMLLNPNSNQKEYVRLTSVQATRTTFVYLSNGDYKTFTGWRIVCGLSNPLQYQWNGGEATPGGTTGGDTIEIYDTDFQDAVRYYGTTTLSTAAPADSAQLLLNNVTAQIVPVAQTETPITDRSAAGDALAVLSAGAGSVTFTAISTSTTAALFTATPIEPGSLQLSINGDHYQDNGIGGFLSSTGAVDLSGASIDYALGHITLGVTLSNGKSLSLTYQPGAAVSTANITGALVIDESNRGLAFTLNLATAKPRPGTFELSYYVLGSWQTLRDNGTGAITGDGSGTIDYSTGSVGLTLAREPDSGSQLVWRYAPQLLTQYDLGSGTNQYSASATRQTLYLGAGIKPGTLSLSNGGSISLTDDGAGNLTGTGGSGTIDYSTGRLEFAPSVLSSSNTLTVECDKSGQYSAAIDLVNTSGSYGFTYTGGAIAERGLSVQVPVKRYDRISGSAGTSATSNIIFRQFVDDGAGGILDENGDTVSGASVNYATGAVNLGSLLRNYTADSVDYTALVPGTISSVSVTETLAGKAAVTIIDSYDSAESDSRSLTLSPPRLRVKAQQDGRQIVPNSLIFTYGGNTYYDNDGKIYRGFSALTGAGIESGSIDYASGVISLTDQPTSGNITPTVTGLLLANQPTMANATQFITPEAPLRPGSLQLTLTNATTGAVVAATSDAAGTISISGSAVGQVDAQTGYVTLSLGFRAFLDQIRYNAVSLQPLPVDADLIGLNAVRLPVDGKVPIFRVGEVAVLNDTQTDTLDTPTASATVTLSRDHLADVVVYGADGATALDPEQYSVDLEAGTLTYSATLVLQDAEGNTLSGDWSASHRIEHMSLITDVQLNGSITLQTASAHDFPAGATVSSALLFGDLQSNVTNQFTQRTWNSSNPNWGTAPDSSGTTSAQYNSVAYPIEVANHGAVEEKWALIFSDTSNFSIVSESRGVIGSGNISTDCAPINPETTTPYFTVRKDGWGSGWATANVLRFDTLGALAPFWIARTVVPGQGTTSSDSFTLSPRGDSQ